MKLELSVESNTLHSPCILWRISRFWICRAFKGQTRLEIYMPAKQCHWTKLQAKLPASDIQAIKLPVASLFQSSSTSSQLRFFCVNTVLTVLIQVYFKIRPTKIITYTSQWRHVAFLSCSCAYICMNASMHVYSSYEGRVATRIQGAVRLAPEGCP